MSRGTEIGAGTAATFPRVAAPLEHNEFAGAHAEPAGTGAENDASAIGGYPGSGGESVANSSAPPAMAAPATPIPINGAADNNFRHSDTI